MLKSHIAYIVLGAVTILGLWLATPLLVSCYFGSAKGPGEFGDIFGATNALFSGLALIGVVVAILLQQRELNLSTQELRSSARALTKQVELAADTARMQALPILMELQKARVRTYGGKYFQHFKESEFTEEYLNDRITEMKQVIVGAPSRMQELKKQIDETPIRPNVYGQDPGRDGLLKQLGDWQQRANVSRDVLPQMELLVSYMRDLTFLYGKMRETKLENEEA